MKRSLPVLPRVCAIIPSWNRMEDLRACLEPLAKQDYPALEIVVVDNGSSDGSAEMV
ncbi:MAG TPA: glycosyltransferase, partial [Planctomycetaceae bacterium]|nr:glycosyltransferase [Planctomycetaceae bacterium]